MKKIHHIVLVLILSLACSKAETLWVTNFNKGKESAKASSRYMLLNFTGSDWCGWCTKLDKEVFSQNPFKLYAKKNLVCTYIDFPQKKQLKSNLKAQNDFLAKKYKIRGFPTILLLTPEGEEIARTGYKPGGAEIYVEHIKKYIDAYLRKHEMLKTTYLLNTE